jgi:hypothetical protein
MDTFLSSDKMPGQTKGVFIIIIDEKQPSLAFIHPRLLP